MFSLDNLIDMVLTTTRVLKPDLYDEVYLAVRVIKEGYELSQTGDFTALTADLAVVLAKVKAGEAIL